jgi:hypothetical protein
MIVRSVRLLLLATLLSPLAAPAQSAADLAKVVSLMQADSYSYKTTTSPSVWTIHFAGDNLKDIKVVVAVGSGDDPAVIVFVTVTEKKTMPVTTDFMRTLLQQNHQMDRVKIAYDADGDLEVRIDATLRVTDAPEFKGIVDQVKNVSDELYGDIKSQLIQ